MSEGKPGGTISGNVLTDAGLYMCAFGLSIGLVFPFFAVLLGVETAVALRPLFIGACAGAGVIVGLVGTFIIRRFVGRPMRRVSQSMIKVRDQLERASTTGERGSCTPEDCRIELNSNDELGDCADAFNALIEVLATAQELDGQIRGLSVGLSEHLEAIPLAEVALEHLVERGPFDAAGVFVMRRDGVELLAASGIVSAHSLCTHRLVLDAIEHGHGRRMEWGDELRIDSALVSFAPRMIDVRVLSSHGVAFGALVLATAEVPGTSTDRLAEVAAASLSLSLRNAITHEEVEQLAALDPLTGVYNRRLGLQRLEEEYGHSARSQLSLAVVLFDIDHFKGVNDTYGHPAGDQVLRAIAEATGDAIRQGDSMVRLGGEEFMAILPGASVTDALELAERMRRVCAETAVAHGSTLIGVTVSLGVAALPDTRVSESAHLIALADEAMYAAKRSGRNRVVHARGELPVSAMAR